MTIPQAPSCFYISGKNLLKGSDGKLLWMCLLLQYEIGDQSKSERPHDTESLLPVYFCSSSMVLPDLAHVITVRGPLEAAMLSENQAEQNIQNYTGQ